MPFTRRDQSGVTIQLGGKTIGGRAPIFIVAEVANTHEGNFETAKRMVDEIKDSGVDAVKFQLHIPEAEMIPSHPKFHTQGKRALSYEQLKELKVYTEAAGLYFLCTPFSREAGDQLVEMGVDAFKIGSGETSDIHFIEHIAKKGKTVILSTGMTSIAEIDEAVAMLRKYDTPFMILHAVSVYPPRYEHLNLGVIPEYQERYKVPVGLSDHTPEIFSAIAAVPWGVSLIEKHYTLDRMTVGTSDHKVSLEPQEWKMLVDGVRKIEKACGNSKEILEEEKSVIEWARHGVVSLRDIKMGEMIEANAVSTKRPLNDGIPARDLMNVIGKKAKRVISKDSLLTWNDIAQ